MPTPIGLRPPSPIATQHSEDRNATSASLPSGSTANSFPNDGPLSGLSARKKNFTQLPEDIHREIADRLPMPDVSRLSRTGRTMHSVFGAETKSFSSLSQKIGSTADLAELHRLTGIGASNAYETGKETILGWNKNRQEELFPKVGTQIPTAIYFSRFDTRTDTRTALLEQCVTDFSHMRPEEVGAAGVSSVIAEIGELPREEQQALFDKSLAAAQAFQPANRATTLHELTKAMFGSSALFAADSRADARNNVVNIAKSSDGIASEQLRPIVEELAQHPNLVMLALDQGDWQTPFRAIIETGSRLSPGDRQTVFKNLNDSLDMIEQQFGPAGINVARECLKTLEPPAAE